MDKLIRKLKEVEAYLFNREMEDYCEAVGEAIKELEKKRMKLEIEVERKFEAMMLDPLCGRKRVA